MPKPARKRISGDKSSGALRTAPKRSTAPAALDVRKAVDWLKSHGTKSVRDGMARYAIPSDRAFGVAMRDIQSLAKRLGRNHELASQLWATGWYEARMLASYVDDPAFVTPRQMDKWCRDFDNWAICDTVLCLV